jgi:hypothetical protein
MSVTNRLTIPALLGLVAMFLAPGWVAAADRPVHASLVWPLLAAGTASLGPGAGGISAASLAMNAAIGSALQGDSRLRASSFSTVPPLTLSLMPSGSSATMDVTLLLQLEALYEQLALMEALMAQANSGFNPALARPGNLGALGTAAYLHGLGNGGPRLAPIRPGIGVGGVRRTVAPMNRNRPKPPPPPRTPRSR